jgi:hypothetical protein
MNRLDAKVIKSNSVAKFPHECNIMFSIVVRNPQMSNNGPNYAGALTTSPSKLVVNPIVGKNLLIFALTL